MSRVAVRMTNDSESDSEQDSESELEDHAGLKIRKLPVVGILLVELCERLTYYTLAGTQKIYLQNQLKKTPSTSAALNSVFNMLCYFWCVPGGLLADSIGRYKTIIAAGSIYAIGTICVGISVIYELQAALGWLFIVGSLVLIAMGSGSIRPNLANFGADQIGNASEKQRECQKTFFSLLYLSVNIGVLIAFGFLANTTTDGLAGVVPQQEGYYFAYASGAGCMILAVLIFVGFTGSYRMLPGNGLGPVRLLIRYQYYSVWNGGGWRAAMSLVGFLCLPLFYIVTLADILLSAAEKSSTEVFTDPCAAPLTEAPPRMLHGGGGGGNGDEVLSDIALVLGSMACSFLAVANVNCTWVQELKQEVNFGAKDARRTFAAIPTIIVVNIAFNLCFNSMSNAFPSQACQMDLRIGSMQLNGAFFHVADAMAVVIFTPIFEFCLYPVIARVKGSPVRFGQKIVAGLVMAAISNVAAAILEFMRKDAPFLCGDAGFSHCAPGFSEDGTEGTRMKDISAFWMFIPFVFVGIAEILVNPSMYCFAYEAAPLEVRSLLQAINFFFRGSVSNAFTALVSKLFFPNDLDKGSLDSYYFVNAALAAIGIIVHFAITHR